MDVLQASPERSDNSLFARISGRSLKVKTDAPRDVNAVEPKSSKESHKSDGGGVARLVMGFQKHY